MGDAPSAPQRLDSWKAIAEYLRRDVGTVRRWERELGLPIRRMPGGRGRSVFAFTSEIDAWLELAPSRSAIAANGASPGAAAPARAGRWRLWLAATTAVAVVAGGAWQLRGSRVTAADLRVEATEHGLTAFGPDGAERWRYPFSAAHDYGMPFTRPWARVVAGSRPSVYAATSVRTRRADRQEESGSLMELDLDGRLQRSFSFGDRVRFNGREFLEPWTIQGFAVDDSGRSRRIAVTAHHYTWSPSLVTVLDDRWNRRGTFVHFGWVEGVHWMTPNRLLVAGFSNAHDGGMVALLDPDAMNGQGPEPAGTDAHCDDCGNDRPIRIIVMPRTELNLATASRFNRAVLEVAPDRILARTYETSTSSETVDALYEFTPSLDLIKASFSERYWEMHGALERQGVLNHSRERCPDKDGPRTLQVWTPDGGWKTVTITTRP